MKTKYKINEIFKSIQGEGMRAGTVNVFVRFTGCNLTCSMEPGPKSPGGFDCDTEFASGSWIEIDELISSVQTIGGSCKWVILTGGEPGLQADKPLIDHLHEKGFQVAIETNGSIDLSQLGLDWICVSPKVAEHAVRQKIAHEVKYVRNEGQSIPQPSCVSSNQLISPAYDGDRPNAKNLAWCKNLILDNPSWRLSVQLHKTWGVR